VYHAVASPLGLDIDAILDLDIETATPALLKFDWWLET